MPADESRAPAGSSLPRLVAIMRKLLSPEGCPWDREQTLETLRSYVIEEAHEVVDAIDRGDPDDLRDELGDLLMQIVFQAELAQRQGWFGPDDVVAAISDKLERRHPHVFGDATVTSTAEVATQWEVIKRREKAGRGLLEGVPVTMPALLRAQRLGAKADRAGLGWSDWRGPRAKLTEELGELDAALDQAYSAGPDGANRAHADPADPAVASESDRRAIEAELGDVLFSCANLARALGVDAEAALRGTLARFSQRVGQAEALAREAGTDLRDCDAAETDRYWERAKRALS